MIVLFLQPLIPWTPQDEDGVMDIGRLDASVYPAVQNFCVAARALGLGTALTTVIRIHTAEVLAALGVPAAPDGSARYEIAALVPVGWPSGQVRRGAPQAGGRGDALEPLGRQAPHLNSGASRARADPLPGWRGSRAGAALNWPGRSRLEMWPAPAIST